MGVKNYANSARHTDYKCASVALRAIWCLRQAGTCYLFSGRIQLKHNTALGVLLIRKEEKLRYLILQKKKKNMAGCPLEPHVLVQFEDDNSSV